MGFIRKDRSSQRQIGNYSLLADIDRFNIKIKHYVVI